MKKMRVSTKNQHQRWYNDEVDAARLARDTALKTQLKNHANYITPKTEREYYSVNIEPANGNNEQIWTFIKELLPKANWNNLSKC